jgi:hypothetical protein
MAVPPQKNNNPVPLLNPQPILAHVNTRTTLYIGGIWGEVRSGQTWTVADGRRFVWSADSMTVIYSQNGKFYAQSAVGFANEVRVAPLAIAGRQSMFMATVAEAEMKLLMGVVAGASGIGFAAVIGTEVLGFVAANRENFSKWNQQLHAVLKARAFLKTHTPVLYDKVFNAVLHQIYKDVKGKLPEAVTPETVAFGIGVVIGSVGKKAAAGKFSLLAIIFVVLEQLVIRFSLNVAPEAVKLSAEDYKKMADEIVTRMREAGINLMDSDAKTILEEVRRHPKEVKEAFEILRSAFETHLRAHR